MATFIHKRKNPVTSEEGYRHPAFVLCGLEGLEGVATVTLPLDRDSLAFRNVLDEELMSGAEQVSWK